MESRRFTLSCIPACWRCPHLELRSKTGMLRGRSCPDRGVGIVTTGKIVDTLSE
jgi:hypothetical protein